MPRIVKPVNIEYEITTACNFSCVHCYCDAGKRSKVELSTEEIFDVIDQLVEADADVLDIVGGEPMLREDLLEIFAYATSRGLNLIMNTNASLATKDYVRKIRNVAPELKVGVSLDGPTADVHEAIRGAGTFEKTYRGLLNFLDAGFDVTLLFVVNRLNYHRLEEMLGLARTLGTGLYVDRFVPVGRGAANASTLLPSPQIISEVGRILKHYLAANRSENGFELIVEENLLNEECTAGRTHASILVDGNVVPCGHFRYEPKFYMGNVRRERFKEIWERFDRDVIMPNVCRICTLRAEGKCASGCLAQAHFDPLGVDSLLCELASKR